MSLRKIILTSLLLYFSTSLLFAANIIRRWNLIIDLDTGKITIANDNAEYQSLLSDSTSTTNQNTGSTISSGSTTQSGSNNVTSTGQTSTTPNSGSVTTTNSWTKTTTTSSELEDAIYRWYVNELTIFDSVTNFQPNDVITREQAAKFFSQGATVVGYTDTYTGNCNFDDTSTANSFLLPAITKACTSWLMRGNGISFKPLSLLTYAESITILSKIAGYRSTSVTNPRWQQYYNFVSPLSLLPSTFSLNTIDSNITRGDMILMLYRLSKKGTIWQSSSTPSNSSSNSPVSLGAGISDDPEFTVALLWMNNIGMTKFWKASDYNPLTALTREQWAQFFSLYDQKFNTNNDTSSGCKLNDISDSNFQTAIQYVCKKWILNWGNNLFRPTETMTKVEFVAWMLNMLRESYTSNTGSWQSNAYKKALSLELINRSDEATFDKPITRYEAAILFHKLYLKNEFKKSLSNADASYTVISPIENESATGTSSNQQKVVIDINSIDNKDFTNGFVELFWQNYKLTKRQVTQYFPTSYVWYGDLIDVSDDKVLGNISMSIGQQGIRKILIDGYIIIDSEWGYYTIKSTDQAWHYIISKAK